MMYDGQPGAVCPAPAGMSPTLSLTESEAKGLPRTCGDEPHYKKTFSVEQLSAPHLRG